MGGKVWSKDLHEVAVSLYVDGKTPREIEERIGVPFKTVYRWVKCAGVIRSRKEEYNRRYDEHVAWLRSGDKKRSAMAKGFHKTKQGYIITTKKCDGSLFVHKQIMEAHIGRRLNDDEVVHHINHCKSDNRIENLKLMRRSDHISLHKKGRDCSFMERGEDGRFIGKQSNGDKE